MPLLSRWRDTPSGQLKLLVMFSFLFLSFFGLGLSVPLFPWLKPTLLMPYLLPAYCLLLCRICMGQSSYSFYRGEIRRGNQRKNRSPLGAQKRVLLYPTCTRCTSLFERPNKSSMKRLNAARPTAWTPRGSHPTASSRFRRSGTNPDQRKKDCHQMKVNQATLVCALPHAFGSASDRDGLCAEAATIRKGRFPSGAT